MSHIKLGDFILLTPCLQQVQKKYENLIIAVPPLLWELYSELRLFTKSISAADMPRFTEKYRDSLQILDLTFPLLDHVSIPTAHFKFSKSFFQTAQHATTSYAQALNEYFPGLDADFKTEPFLQLNTNADVLTEFGVQPFLYFTLHAGSDFAAKNWAPQNFERTCELILDHNPGLHGLSFVGPQDQELYQDRPKPTRFTSVKTGLRNVAHLLSASLLHIDNDSGVHHLAGALDVPSITVFGPTGPGTWGSMTKRNFIHWGAPSCASPCGGEYMTKCTNKVCLSSVEPKDLFTSAMKILSAYNHL